MANPILSLFSIGVFYQILEHFSRFSWRIVTSISTERGSSILFEFTSRISSLKYPDDKKVHNQNLAFGKSINVKKLATSTPPVPVIYSISITLLFFVIVIQSRIGCCIVLYDLTFYLVLEVRH